MRVRIGHRWWRVWAYDLESRSDEESVKRNETSVWLSSFIDENSKIEDEENYFYGIESFLNRLRELASRRRKHGDSKRPVVNQLIYIWNLSFEWSFLLPQLLSDGFGWTEKIEKEDEFVFSSVSTKTASIVWRAQIKFEKKDGIIEFRDLNKIFAGSLRSVAKSFGLETQKGKIDYKMKRPEGYMPTKEEKEYCFKDTRIVMEILMKMQEKGDKDFWGSVSAATYSCRKMLKVGYSKSYHPKEAFRKQYPRLGTEESEFVRRSLAGGIAYAPPRWQFKEIKAQIGHIDFHQSHPSRMARNVFPYGEGEKGEGEPPWLLHRIYCCHVRVSFSGVILHSVIRLIGIDAIDELDLTLWDFEIDLMKKVYLNLRIEYVDYYAYKYQMLPWRKYFKDNYRKRLEAKKSGDQFNVMYFKLLNNSCFGKFCENGNKPICENYVDEDGYIDSKLHRKDIIDCNASYTYLPVGSCVPAYSRVALIESALKLDPTGERIIYFDTDSIFFIKDEVTMGNIDKLRIDEEMGSFGWEDDCREMQVTAPKRYKLKHADGVTEVKMAGVTLPEKPIYEEMNMIDGEYSANSRVRAKGGTLIVEKAKKLKIQDKYSDIYKRNSKRV